MARHKAQIGQNGARAPTRRAEVAWLATKGTAWVLRRSTDLVPGLLYLAVRELGHTRRES